MRQRCRHKCHHNTSSRRASLNEPTGRGGKLPARKQQNKNIGAIFYRAQNVLLNEHEIHVWAIQMAQNVYYPNINFSPTTTRAKANNRKAGKIRKQPAAAICACVFFVCVNVERNEVENQTVFQWFRSLFIRTL